MTTDRGPWPAMAAARRPTEREGRIRTCVPARATARELGNRESRRGRRTADQDWNVVRGED